MSLQACVKELLCDPDVSKEKAIYNAKLFLQRQAESLYRKDPSQVLEIKGDIEKLLRPHLERGIQEVVTYLDQKTTD